MSSFCPTLFAPLQSSAEERARARGIIHSWDVLLLAKNLVRKSREGKKEEDGNKRVLFMYNIALPPLKRVMGQGARPCARQLTNFCKYPSRIDNAFAAYLGHI